mgnify:CR=1 FL=1
MTETKQKILIVHNYYQIPGGEDTVVANEKKMLEDHGHQVALYTRHNSEMKTFSKIQKLLLPFSTIFSLKTYREVKALIKKEKVDAVHVHNTLNLISPSVYYAAFHCKVPVVQTIHNFRLLCPGAAFYRDGHICEDCVSKGLMCAVKYSCYRGSRLQTLACVISTGLQRILGTYGRLNYICLTEFNKNKLLQLKQMKEENIYVKPNFVEASTKIMSYEERKEQFVYAGRLDSLKGIDVLLKAWEMFEAKEEKLIICGTGPEESWCKKYVEEHHLKNVELKGFVENTEVKKIIGESKALILPTRWYEGFPMTIVESYSVGTPVVASDLGNAGSLVEEGKSGLKFQTDSPESLCETLKKTKTFKGLDENYINRYSEESNYEQLRNIYEACSNHHEYTGTIPG